MSPSSSSSDRDTIISSGLPGLDELLGGGFVRGRAYQVRGHPGAGKTILGRHFLTAPDGDSDGNAARDESSLLITFDEPAAQHRVDATGMGLDLDDVEILDLSPTSDEFAGQSTSDLFLSPDLEQDRVGDPIISTVDEVAPSRIVVDTMTHLRYMSADAAQYRQQALAFLRFLKDHESTALLLTEWESSTSFDSLLFLSDGVIDLTYESERRNVEVVKQRGQGFQDGRHAMQIGADGMEVYPRLHPDGDRIPSLGETFSSGIPELDALMGGGIERHTMTIISGSSGVGKTTLALQFVKEAAGQGERSVFYSFEEDRETLVHRASSISIPVEQMIEQGTLVIKEPRPWTFNAGRFAQEVRREVESEGTKLVVIDSLAGYRECLKTTSLRPQVHRLRNYLIGRGVTGFLLNELQDITGDFQATGERMSHLADNLVFLRYLEMRGELRKAIGVLKKRASDFEKSLREFQISAHGIRVGEPLTQLRKVLTGTPEWVDDEESMAPMDEFMSSE